MRSEVIQKMQARQRWRAVNTCQWEKKVQGFGCKGGDEHGFKHPNSTKDRCPNFLSRSGGTFLHPVTWAHWHCSMWATRVKGSGVGLAVTLARGQALVPSSCLPTYCVVSPDIEHYQKGTPTVQGVSQSAKLFLLKFDFIVQVFFIPSELILGN